MATTPQTADGIRAALDSLQPDVRTRKMFGEYALYYQDVVVGFICDNKMFLKDTAAGRRLLVNPVYGKVYQGSKDYLLLDNDTLGDEELFALLVAETKAELPIKKKR
jgi:DNA transformation protein